MATPTLKIKGNWNEIKKNLKKQYPNLSDSDLTFKEGKETELVDHLQKKLGKKRDEVVNIVNNAQREMTEHGTEKSKHSSEKEHGTEKVKQKPEKEWQED